MQVKYPSMIPNVNEPLKVTTLRSRLRVTRLTIYKWCKHLDSWTNYLLTMVIYHKPSPASIYSY